MITKEILSDDVLETAAAQKVKDTIPNYDRVPKGIKALRQLPLGNFVAFPAEIMRTSYHILSTGLKEINSGSSVIKQRGLQRIAGFAATQSSWGVAAGYTASLAGLNEEQAQAVAKLDETPWSKDSPRFIFRDDEGDLNTIDTQFLNSYSYIQEPFLKIYNSIQKGELSEQGLNDWMINNSKDISVRLLSPYVSESILTDAIVNVGYAALISERGETPDGKKLFADDMDGTERAWNFFTETVKAIAPGSALSFGDLVKAALELENPSTGDVLDFGNQMAANATGVKARKLNPETKMGYKTGEYEQQLQKNAGLQINYARDSKALVNRYINLQRERFNSQKEFYKNIESYRILNGTRKTRRLLEEKGLSKNKINALLRGYYEPTGLSRRSINTMLEKSPISRGEVRSTKRKIDELERKFTRIKLIEPAYEKFSEEKERVQKDTGGVVNVPNAPTEPDERIDKYTGRPYNEQAGEAYIDVEERMEKKKGGKLTAREQYSKAGLLKQFLKPKTVDTVEDVVSQSKNYEPLQLKGGKILSKIYKDNTIDMDKETYKNLDGTEIEFTPEVEQKFRDQSVGYDKP